LPPAADVSRETFEGFEEMPAMTGGRASVSSLNLANPDFDRKLRLYAQLLSRWGNAMNLVSGASFANFWARHIADSAQLLAYAPSARRWVDLGSGAGLPGIVIAIQLAEYSGAVVHCIESDKRKAAFLRQVARATLAPALVHVNRIEVGDANCLNPVDAVTARGLAPLPRLIGIANTFLRNGAVGVFPCGRSAQTQVRSLSQTFKLEIEAFPSKVAIGQIMRMRSAAESRP
jgi:16S rRNA (guanine527-N7)-methyltransferase